VEIKYEKSKTSRQKVLPTKASGDKWELHLYVAGHNSKAVTALSNLKFICEEQLKGKYHIEVIDLLQNPQIAHDNQILAVPTLVRKLPLPERNIIGDLSNRERVLFGLGLIEECAPVE